ncbi:hypothetical protein F4703DRAFT_1925594 [Phycomyces blakesleeanus]
MNQPSSFVMSAFSFINAKQPSRKNSKPSSSFMSTSILDDIYDENLNYSHDQPSTPQDTHKSRQSVLSLPDYLNHSSGASHASLSEISLSATSPSVPKHINPEPKKSVFSFIGGASNPKSISPRAVETTKPKKQNNTISPAFVVHPSSSNVVFPNGYKQSLPSLNSINSDSRKLSEQTAWKQIQAEKKQEMALIQRLYERYDLVNNQIKQISNHNLKAEKEEALEAEDYLAAGELQLKQEDQVKQTTELFTNTLRGLDDQIQQSWESLAAILSRESKVAENLADEERAQKLEKADFNYKSHHETKLQQINEQRTDIGQEKSEIAFDLDMWEQSNTEFNEKMYELVHEEQDEKEELEEKESRIQVQINELMEAVKKLEKERNTYIARISELDSVIEQVLSEYTPEKDAHSNEYLSIETRKEQMETRCTNLDQEDTELHHQLKRHTEEIGEEWALLKEEEEKIRVIETQADNSKFEAEKMKQTCFDVVRVCNKSIEKKKKEIYQFCEDFAQQKRKMELAQKNAFKAQQKLEELEEVVEHTEYQIKSLKRQKSLAVESGQFQNAAIAAERIKSSQNLLESVSKKRDTQHEESKHCQSILCEYKDEMSKLEKEYKELIKLAVKSTESQLFASPLKLPWAACGHKP